MKYLYDITVTPEQDEAFVANWVAGSELIQAHPGAQGTHLYYVAAGQYVAIAEWESEEAREAAQLSVRSDPAWHDNTEFGEVTVTGWLTKVASVGSRPQLTVNEGRAQVGLPPIEDVEVTTCADHGPWPKGNHNWRIGRISHLVSPGCSWCGRCKTTWNFVAPHFTYYTQGAACFALCEKCWVELATPAARVPYYVALAAERTDHGQREMIVAAAKAEGMKVRPAQPLTFRWMAEVLSRPHQCVYPIDGHFDRCECGRLPDDPIHRTRKDPPEMNRYEARITSEVEVGYQAAASIVQVEGTPPPPCDLPYLIASHVPRWDAERIVKLLNEDEAIKDALGALIPNAPPTPPATTITINVNMDGKKVAAAVAEMFR